ncbi:hypothetical protein B0T17DRAFT_594004 [Bombardia bombarda]|uniref:Cyclin n=1 Tax=Bombardia bombarda TaxID=252184 RepID=A0AA39TJQ3_9PEZI|nr:hypothetical protein B0T17DRAFT_594004 [Bombardia bombarda]
MGTAYQVPKMASYENSHIHHSAYPPTMASSDRTRVALNERSAPNEHMFNPTSRCPASSQNQNQQQYALSQSRTLSCSCCSCSTPYSSGEVARGGAMAGTVLSSRDSDMVMHSLAIPPCISPLGGNLADFVAELTALFWFESIKVLQAAENVQTLSPTAPVWRITDSAIACQHFKKWVHSVLSTTQVTQNVILLALMFIYRLKVANPIVKGRPGSEYRLLTVALMLGNKFLDDNTYTNKTWADVSGISVTEIHVMEVEFLSNMRYSLLASEKQWEEWLVKLARFREFLDRAQRSASPSPLLIPSPTHRGFASSSLPSPTGTLQLTPSLHPAAKSFSKHSPSSNPFSNNTAGQAWPAPYPAYNAISPLALKPEMQTPRKRSFPEEDLTEPAAKRTNRVLPPQPPVSSLVPTQAPSRMLVLQQHPVPLPTQSRPAQGALPDQVHLSVPNLTLNTTHNSVSNQAYPGVTYAPPQASPLSLPPLVPGVRAMTSVYPPTTASYGTQLPVLSTSGSSVPSTASVITPTTAYPPVNYGTPTKRQSPRNVSTPTAAYPGSSPLSETFHQHTLTPIGHVGSTSGVHTPISHSPSIYLQQRNSPYKPVRHVNTLLYPASSAFLQQYHFTNIVPPAQMHYQPLGRRNEFRTGIVPEFAMVGPGQHGAAAGQHRNVTPASYQPVSQVLPTPNQGRPQYPPPLGRPVQPYYPRN